MDATDYWTDAFKRRAQLIPHATHRSPESDAIRQSWDEEEAALRKAIALVRERRNTLTLPSVLPPELLGHVFLALRDAAAHDCRISDERWDSVKVRKKKTWLSWNGVSHVSRHWRTVALSLPSLWTEIFLPYSWFPKLKPWEIFLERSREAAVSLTGHLETVTDMGNDTLRRHLGHIRSLRLSRSGVALSPENPQRQLVSTIMTGGMPLLETLVVDLENRPSEHSFPFTLSREFLSAGAPKLQRLHIYQGSFPWGVICQGMRYLSVHAHIRDPSSINSMSAVLRTLRAMQRLEFLSLTNVLPEDERTDGEPAISLPYLDRLHLEGYRAASLDLLALLLVPKLRSLTGWMSDDRSDLPRRLPLLPAYLDTSGAEPVSFLYANVGWHWPTDLYSDDRLGGLVKFAVAESEPSFPPDRSRNGRPGITISFVTKSVAEAHGQAYVLASQAPAHAIRSVHLDGVRWSTLEMHSLLSPATQHIVELSLTATRTAVTACEALLQSGADSDFGWLAALRTLKLDCDLAHVPPTGEGSQIPLRDIVTKILAKKIDRSGPLDTLILGGTGATHVWIQEHWSGFVKFIDFVKYKWKEAHDDSVNRATAGWDRWGE